MKPKDMSVQDVPAFAEQGNTPRVNQQSLLPAAIKQRLLGEIIGSSTGSLSLGSGVYGSSTMPDATSASFLFTTTDSFNRVILVVPDVAIYVNATTATISTADAWPNNSYGQGNVPVTVFNDWGLTNNVNYVCRVGIRNNSGGSINVIVVYRGRIISNALAGQTGTNV